MSIEEKSADQTATQIGSPDLPPGLYLVATPIGNLEDLTFRAARILRQCDRILAEDTRRTQKLLSHLEISKPLLSCNEQNEAGRAEQVPGWIRAGERVVLVSDAGMPTLADPGYRCVRACLAENLPVDAIPGVSAVPLALALSGLPPARFAFEGFFPRKSGRARRLAETMRDDDRTTIFFESPFRIQKTLNLLSEVMGDRSIAVCREMTKQFAEVLRGSATHLAKETAKRNWKGEITVVVAGVERKPTRFSEEGLNAEDDLESEESSDADS